MNERAIESLKRMLGEFSLLEDHCLKTIEEYEDIKHRADLRLDNSLKTLYKIRSTKDEIINDIKYLEEEEDDLK